MCITSLKVNMLGGLSIQSGGAEINDSDNRSRKVWLLLAYMIYCRKRPVTQEELVRLLWDDGDNVTNPANALKTMFHRVRTTLDRLGDSAGHILIVRQGGSYAWNCKVPLTLDVEEFDELCQAASDATRPKERLERYLKALELYNGDFWPTSPPTPGWCPWRPITTTSISRWSTRCCPCWRRRTAGRRPPCSAARPSSWTPTVRSSIGT